MSIEMLEAAFKYLEPRPPEQTNLSDIMDNKTIMPAPFEGTYVRSIVNSTKTSSAPVEMYRNISAALSER